MYGKEAGTYVVPLWYSSVAVKFVVLLLLSELIVAATLPVFIICDVGVGIHGLTSRVVDEAVN